MKVDFLKGRVAQAIIGIGIATAIAATFQNCGGGFKAFQSSALNQSSTSTQLLNSALYVDNTDFQNCYSATPTDATAMSACLGASANKPQVFTSTTISSCLNSGNTTAEFLAICLYQNGATVLNNRPPKQNDIDGCAALGPTSNIATCLAAHGTNVGITPTTVVTQANIDYCVSSVGEANVEKCLHTYDYIPTNPILMQHDSTLCEKVTGGTSGIALCLQNANLLSSTVTQANIDSCVTAATDAKVVRCLRANYLVPNVLMQWHIDTCNTAVGPAAIATCLDNNGVLPIDPTSALTSTQIAAYVQNDINACITAVGEPMVAQCLRKRKIISNEVMQPHIDSCFAVAGVNAFTCLQTNFAVLPTALIPGVLMTCFVNNMNSSANAAACLAKQKILLTAPLQIHISSCARFAGVSVDTTGTKPSQVGIAACLASSAVLPTGVTQAEIDTCVTAVGLANVAACLNNKGYVPAYSQMLNTTTGVFAVCTQCHNATTMNGNMDISEITTVDNFLTPGDSAGSKLYTDVASGNMPRALAGQAKAVPLTAAQIATIGLWIDQGANDDVDVPPTAPALLSTGTATGNLTAGGGLAVAFDGATATTAAKSAEAAAAGGMIGKNFGAGTPKTVTSWEIWGSTDLCYNNPVVNGATTLLLQYSDDGVTYTTADSVTTTATCAGPEMISRNLPGPNMAHQYWQVTQAAGAKGALIVGELQFFGY